MKLAALADATSAVRIVAPPPLAQQVAVVPMVNNLRSGQVAAKIADPLALQLLVVAVVQLELFGSHEALLPLTEVVHGS